ncbi:MAG TPA: substrate-binding domain-containing protein, partial [Magnetospirillaceae bacterium]|nr:substrate-binding domain-containing protein [Magnetospirillaceae bacterium]
MKKGIAIMVLAVAAVGVYAQGRFAWVVAASDDKDRILPGINPAAVTGTIITAGSSTVFPLSEAIAEQFKKDGFRGQITVDSIGTGAGFERFTNAGETDIANASSRIRSSHIEAAARLTPPRVPIEFRVGTDAVAVVVSRRNRFVENLTMAELQRIFSTAVFWSDVRPEWPRREIRKFSPGTDSGTFEYFVDHVFRRDRKPILETRNLQLSENDDVLARGIAGDQFAIG